MLQKILKTDIPSILIMMLVPLFIVGGGLVHNKALLPMDILSAYPPWRGVLGKQEIANALLSDIVYQIYPWQKLAYEEAQARGHFPLWNPYELTGQVLVGNAQSALYYPPNLLLHWLRPEIVAVIRAYFNFLMLGIFTFYFCREIKLVKVASLLAAVVAMLAGTAIVWMSWPHINSMASFPLLLLSIEKIINRKPLYPWIGALGAGVGLSLLGGHPETSFHIFLATALYFIFRLIIKRPGLKNGLICSAAVTTGVLIGLLIGAIQWMPFVDSLLPSATAVERGREPKGFAIFYSRDWRYNLSTAVTYLIPNFFGSSSTGNYFWPFANYQNYNEQSVYFGLIPLALAVSVLFNLRKRPQASILIAVSLVFLAVAWRLPGFEAVNHLPIFKLVANSRMKLFIPIMMAIVAGIGLNDWLNNEYPEETRLGSRIIAMVPPVITVLLFAMIGIFSIFYSSLDLQHSKYQLIIKNLTEQIFTLHQPRTMVSLLVAVVFLLLCVLYWRRIINPSFFSNAVVMVTLTELVVMGWKYNPVVDQKMVYPDIPLVSLLSQESQPYRVLSTNLSIFPPNAGVVYGIAQVEGYDYPIFRKFFDIFQAQGGHNSASRQVWSIDFPLIDWLNVRYVISDKPIQKDGYRLVFDQPAYKVYQNENAFPRAYMVYDYQVIEDSKRLLKTMVSTPEILKQKALFTQLPAGVSMELTSSAVETNAKVEFQSYGTDRVVLQADTARAGFLVMTDIYSSGWKVNVDSHEVPLLNADYAYRAVYLPAGQHQVEFYYQPVSFILGRGLSLLGLCIILAGIGSLIYYRHKLHRVTKES